MKKTNKRDQAIEELKKLVDTYNVLEEESKKYNRYELTLG